MQGGTEIKGQGQVQQRYVFEALSVLTLDGNM